MESWYTIPKQKLELLKSVSQTITSGSSQSVSFPMLEKRNAIEQSTDLALRGKPLPLGKSILESFTLTFTDTSSAALI